MRNTNTREIVRSRTTMSYAFEAALNPYRGLPATWLPELAVVVASALRDDKGRKAPAWTVTRKEQNR